MTYFFVGIKGAGMSALAIILKQLGYDVCGSDKKEHFFTQELLEKNNIKVYEFNKNNIKKGMTIIKGNTYGDDHEEIAKAKELKLVIYTYQEILGRLTNMYKTITIAGCHGKTTTTSMLSHVFNNVRGCNYLVGDGTGHSSINNEYFVLEACEYKRHFLNYRPYYAVITNIDLDHTDYYKDIEDVLSAYQEYATKARYVIACGDDIYTHRLNIVPFYYGVNDGNDVIAKNTEYTKDGISFDVYIKNNYYGHFDLPFYGKHMLLNTLAVISVCYLENLKYEDIYDNLKTFEGAQRRFSETVINDCVIIDDYAHHPNEIKAVIDATKQKYPNKKIVSIFQPHTFTRTKSFYKEIADELNKAYASYILPIHPSREKQEDYPNITSDLIVDNLVNGHHINIDDAKLLNNYNDVVFLFMSPNDISKLENDLIELKKELF